MPSLFHMRARVETLVYRKTKQRDINPSHRKHKDSSFSISFSFKVTAASEMVRLRSQGLHTVSK